MPIIMSLHLTKEQVSKLCRCMGLPEVRSLTDINSTFSNDVQVINGELILKSWDKEKIKWFNKEVFCLTNLKDKIPLPRIICSDWGGEILGKPFIVMNRIPGIPLIEVWDQLPEIKQEAYIEQICEYLKIVNQLQISNAIDLFPAITSWQEWLRMEFELNFNLCKDKKIFKGKKLISIQRQIDHYLPYLKEQNMQVMYYDIHFGNFIINETGIGGMIDFERTEWVSIDYCLNWPNRMSKHPEEYIQNRETDKAEYAKILPLFNKHYPEMFAFQDLDKRLEAYALLSDMRIQLRKLNGVV